VTCDAHHSTQVIATPIAGVHITSSRSGRSFVRHWHGTYSFGLMDHGAQTSASGRGTVQACAGQVMTSNPGEVHDGRPFGGASRSWRMVHVEPSALLSAVAGEAGERFGAGVEIAQPVIDDAGLRAAIAALLHRSVQCRLAAACGADAVLACDEAFAGACGLLLSRHASQLLARDDDDVPVHQARDCLADRTADPPTLAELAALVGLSRFQLVRRFSRSFGLSPYAWLMQQRAERARALIRAGQALAQAAHASGFADQSHMTRSFVRQFGFTPGAWRRAMLSR
jgi:AraC-like DNA-binding protein